MIRFGESTRLFHVIGPAGMEPAEEQVQQTLEDIRIEKLQRKNGGKQEESKDNIEEKYKAIPCKYFHKIK